MLPPEVKCATSIRTTHTTLVNVTSTSYETTKRPTVLRVLVNRPNHSGGDSVSLGLYIRSLQVYRHFHYRLTAVEPLC